MSWSVNKTGDCAEVSAEIVAHLSRFQCVDPEEGVKKAAVALIVAALAAQGPATKVTVAANGHQSGSEEYPPVRNTLRIDIQPQYE